LAHEVYSIDRVTAVSPLGEEVEYAPFYSVRHAADAAAEKTFWYATRRPAGQGEGPVDRGTEVYLTLVDLGFRPSAPGGWTVTAETTCLNRDLPHRLPFGGDQPRLQLSEGGGPVGRLGCLTHPTGTARPPRKHGALWRLISHLTLNHLSLVDLDDQTHALREVLKLYDFADTDESHKMIDGIVDVRSRRVVGPVGSAAPGIFCRGVEVTIQFDEEQFSGSGLFLFAAVLERFLALYCSMNSFSKLVASTKERGELRRWPPRTGEQVLV
jgi:type VI secretion system protein ImpG